MSTIDIETINTLLDKLSVTGQPMPYWLEEAVRKLKFDKAQTVVADHLEIKAEAEKLKEQQQPYEKRVNALFADFDLSIPEDYKKYKSAEVEATVVDSTQKIRKLADDISKLSELADNNPELKEKGVAITRNLLGRLQAALNLSEEERKRIEVLTPDEQLKEYAKLVKEPTAEVLQVIDRSQARVTGLMERHHELVNSGKSMVDIVGLYDETLNRIEKETGIEKVTFRNRVTKYETSLDEVRTQAKDLNTISKSRLEQLQREKTAAAIEL